MSTLISASYAAAAVASASGQRLGALILAAGQNPTPETISASTEAQTQLDAAVLVFRKALDASQREAEELASLVEQQSGVGGNLDTYA